MMSWEVREETYLFAWSQNPFNEASFSAALAANAANFWNALTSLHTNGLGGSFGVYVDDAGNFYNWSGDANGDGRLDLNPAQPAYQLEDTGLNRVLGADQSLTPGRFDRLYGGTGLDFMYGFGASPSTPDQLYDRRGHSFEARGALAGGSGKSMPNRRTRFGTTAVQIGTMSFMWTL